jgi:hypothetical protein
MTAIDLRQMERNIARCRVVLSVAAIAVVYIDPILWATAPLATYLSFGGRKTD